MPHIEELRRQRAGINEQVQAPATIDASGGTTDCGADDGVCEPAAAVH